MSKLLKLSTYLIIFAFVLFGISQLEPVQKFISSVNAATPVLNGVFLKTDGTAPFDGATWTPTNAGDGSSVGTNIGQDSSNVNNVVRVGDQMTYRVESSVNDSDVCNHTVTITLDQNQYFTNLPTACLTVAPVDYAANGCSTLIPVSSISVDKRTLVCNLGFTKKATLKQVSPVATVSSVFKNASGNIIGGNNRYITANATVSADGATSITLPTLQTLTTASFKLDLVKSLAGDTGWVVNSDPATHTQEGRTLTYAMSLVVKKGSEMPNTNSFQFVDNYIYISGYNHSQLLSCGVNKGEVSGLPYGDNTVTGATATNSLSQLASVNCIQTTPSFPSATVPITVNITNAATTPATIPTRNVDNSSVTVGDTVIYSGYIKIWVPKDDVFCYGTGGNWSWGSCSGGTTLSATNTYTSVKDSTNAVPKSFSGIDNYLNIDEATTTGNNSATNNMLASEPGGWCADYSNNLDRGCGANKNGLGQAVSGLKNYTGVTYGTSNMPQLSVVTGPNLFQEATGTMSSTYMCLPVDTRYVSFAGLRSNREETFPHPSSTSYNPNSYIHSDAAYKNGTGAIQDCSNLSDPNVPCDQIYNDPVFEYSTTPYPAFSSKYQGDMYMISTGCGDAEGNWQSYDPSQPTPTGITKLRLKVQLNDGAENKYAITGLYAYPKFNINSGLAVGTKLPFFAKASNDMSSVNNFLGDKYNSAYVCETGNTNCGFKKLSAIFDNPGTIVATPKAIYADYVNAQLTYDPIAGTQSFGIGYSFNSAGNDIITIISAQASVAKDILNTAGTAIDNSNTVHLPGDTIKYQITPALIAPSGSGDTTVTLKDDLGVTMEYVPGSTVCDNSQGGDCTGVGDPTITTTNYVQTLVWNIPALDSQHYVLPKITYAAKFWDTVGNGTYTNTVRITSPLDSCSTDTSCARYSQYAASRSVSINLPAQFNIEKAQNGSPIEVNSLANYNLKYYSTVSVNYGQMIDVFPYNGDSRGTSVNGQVQFNSLAVHNGQTVEYTTATPSTVKEDPCDVSNVAAGLVSTFNCPVLPGGNGVVETPAGNQTVLAGDDQSNLVGGTVGTGSTTWVSVTAPFTSANIPSNATAIRITIANKDANPSLTVVAWGYQMELALLANGSHKGDVLQNSITTRIANMRLPIYSQAQIDIIGSTLGDKVWQDLNGNGTQDLGEPGISGVTVCITGGNSTNPPVDPMKLDPGADMVFGTADDKLLCTITDVNGNYLFTNLHSGTYTVTVTPPAGAIETYDLDGINTLNKANVASGINSSITAVDFGYRGSLIISGTVYEELVTVDNTKNGTDVGISGVTVQLKDGAGNIIATTTTLADGSYSFGNLLPGNYTVVETQPTTKNYNSTEAPTNEIPLTLVDANLIGQNFGEVVYPPIVGKVYVDGTNTPLANVTITLKDSLGNVVATTTTLADGSYKFTNIPTGNYTITETQPTGYLEGIVNPSDVISITQSLTPLPSQDFSEKTLMISGTVYEDKDLSFSLDKCSTNVPPCPSTKLDDTMLSTVTVNLLDSLGNVVATTTTDANGNYSFTGLLIGNYTVVEVQPTGYTSTENNTNQVLVNLTSSNVTGINFGETLPNTISGYIYVDTNNNGVKDAGETPLSGETVAMFGVSLTEKGMFVGPFTTTTNASGYYEFTNVTGGFYYVIETQPSNYLDGKETLGSLGVDFSAILVNDTMFMVVTSGEKAENYNFGEIPYPPVFGKIYVDGTNKPLPGVTLTLRDSAGNVVGTTTTDINGNYVFTNVKPGDYTITETQPSGYSNGIVNPSNVINIKQTTAILGSQDFSEMKVLPTTGAPTLIMQLLELFH